MSEDKEQKEQAAEPESTPVVKKKAPKKKAAKKTPEPTSPGREGGLRVPVDEDGNLDWRSFISKKYVVFKNNALDKRGIDASELSPEAFQELLDESDDSEKLILLDGFKDLMHARGFTRAHSNLVDHKGESVTVEYTIDWAEKMINGELHPAFSLSAIASANHGTTKGPFRSYLERIAENRAMACAIKNSLNIKVLADQELPLEKEVKYIERGPDNNEKGGGDYGHSLPDKLQKVLDEKGKSFEDLKKWAGKQGVDFGDAKGPEELQPPLILAVLSKLKKT